MDMDDADMGDTEADDMDEADDTDEAEISPIRSKWQAQRDSWTHPAKTLSIQRQRGFLAKETPIIWTIGIYIPRRLL